MEEECQSTVGKIMSVPAGTVSAIASCTHRASQDTAHKLLGRWGLGAHGAVWLGAVGIRSACIKAAACVVGTWQIELP